MPRTHPRDTIDKKKLNWERWYAKNMEYRKEYQKIWIGEHPGYHKEWRQSNRDKSIMYSKKSYQKHIKKRREEAKIMIFQNRNIPIIEWEVIKRQYDYQCWMCGENEPEIKLTVDHILPTSRNGVNTIDNIQPLCRSCNAKKGNKSVFIGISLHLKELIELFNELIEEERIMLIGA